MSQSNIVEPFFPLSEEQLIEDQKNCILSRYGSSAPGYEEETQKDIGFRVMIAENLQGRITYTLNEDDTYEALMRVDFDSSKGGDASMIIFKNLTFEELTDWARNPSLSNYENFSNKEKITGKEGPDGKFVADEQN